MEIIKNTIDYKNLNIQKYFDTENICFLDIETTGLSRESSIVYLVGILYFEDGTPTIKQLFCNSIEHESLLLAELKRLLEPYEYIITFNGDSFDIPFLNYRYNKNNFDFNISKFKSIDIYKIIKSNKGFLNLKSLKLKSLEEYIGIFREDSFNGKECIELYYKYIKEQNEDMKRAILKHNYDDVYYLPLILKIFDIIKREKMININHSFFKNCNEIEVNIEQISIANDVLDISCKTTSLNKSSIVYFKDNYNLNWNFPKGKLEMSLLIRNGMLSDNKKCNYLIKTEYPIGNKGFKNLGYNISNDIVIIKIENQFINDNIKDMIKNIIISILDELV